MVKTRRHRPVLASDEGASPLRQGLGADAVDVAKANDGHDGEKPAVAVVNKRAVLSRAQQHAKRIKRADKPEGSEGKKCPVRGSNRNPVRSSSGMDPLPLIGDDLIGMNDEKENVCVLGDGLVIHKRMSGGLVAEKERMAEKRAERTKMDEKLGRGAPQKGAKKIEGRFTLAQDAQGAHEDPRQEVSPDDVLVGLHSMPSMLTSNPTNCATTKNSKNQKNKRTHRTRSRVVGLRKDSLAYPKEPAQAVAATSTAGGNIESTDRPTINNLPDDCMRLIFHHCATDAERSSILPRQNPLLSTLPLVCQRWRSLLSGPSDAWSESTLVIDTSHKLDYPVMQRFMEARSPAIRSLRLTNEKRLIRTTAQRGTWVTMLQELNVGLTSQIERLRIDDARVFDIIDFFQLGGDFGGDDVVNDGFDAVDGVDGASNESSLPQITPKTTPSRTTAKHLANLRSLELRGLHTLPKRFPELLNKLPRLEHLELSFDALVMEGVSAFDGCAVGHLPEELFSPKLKCLAIKCKYISNVPAALLDRMSLLEELRLEGVVCKQVFPCADALRRVKRLVLTGSTGFFDRTSIGTPRTNESRDFGSLAFGVASSQPVQTATDRMFMLLKAMPMLEELVVDGCGIREIPMAGETLASDSVKRISMNNNPDMVFKKGLSCFRGLEELRMRRCNMPVVSSAVTSLPRLKYLDVSNNGLVECHNLGKLKELETLVAANNQFPCIPRDVLGMKSLRSVDLSGCAYLEFHAGLLHLMSGWPKLVRLDLRKGRASGTGSGQQTAYQESSRRWLTQVREAWSASCSVLF